MVLLTKSRRGLARAASVAVAVIILASAFGGVYYVISTTSAGTTKTTTAAPLTDVTFGFAGPPDVTDTPGIVFWDTFARQAGLNLHVQYFDGDASVAEALVGGSIQIAEGGFQSTLLADQAAGNSSGSYPFVVFAPYESTNDYALVVSNSIHTWADLAGKPVATSGPGSTSNLFCVNLETQHGLSGSQINCAPTGGGGTRIRALLAGQVVGDIAEPFAIVSALVTGNYHIIATIPSQLPNLLFSVLYTSRTYATAHPDVMTKLTKAIILADRWAQNETAWVAKEQAVFPSTNLTVAATAWKMWIPMNLWNPNGGLTETKITYSENYLLNTSAITKFLAPKYWVDLSYQTQALADLGPWSGPANGYVNPNIPSLNVTLPSG